MRHAVIDDGIRTIQIEDDQSILAALEILGSAALSNDNHRLFDFIRNAKTQYEENHDRVRTADSA